MMQYFITARYSFSPAWRWLCLLFILLFIFLICLTLMFTEARPQRPINHVHCRLSVAFIAGGSNWDTGFDFATQLLDDRPRTCC
jgi:hypothetical protein